MKARSGAQIVPPENPTGSYSWPPEAAELPADIPDITHQLSDVLELQHTHPMSTIKLVLMNGCANDVHPGFPFLCNICGTFADLFCAVDARYTLS